MSLDPFADRRVTNQSVTRIKHDQWSRRLLTNDMFTSHPQLILGCPLTEILNCVKQDINIQIYKYINI